MTDQEKNLSIDGSAEEANQASSSRKTPRGFNRFFLSALNLFTFLLGYFFGTKKDTHVEHNLTSKSDSSTSSQPYAPIAISFIPDYRIALLSGLGILGFIVGCILLFYPDVKTIFTDDSVFHEMVYVPKKIISDSVDNKILTLENEIKSRSFEKKNAENLLKSNPAIQSKDSIAHRNQQVDEQAAIAKEDISRLKTYQVLYSHTSISDTASFKSINSALHFQITMDSLKKWDSIFTACKTDSIKYLKFSTGFAFKDPKISFSIAGIDTFRIKKYSSDIEFITKYPSAGIWILLLLSLVSFTFISISTCVHLKNKIVDLFSEHGIKGLSSKDYYGVTFFTLLALGLVTFFWFSTFYDGYTIRNLYFMKSLNTSMQYIVLLGFLSGAFCLAGFIHTAAMLGCFAGSMKSKNRDIKHQKDSIVQQEEKISNQQLQTAIVDKGELVIKQSSLDLQESEYLKEKTLYKNLLGYFNTYFLLSSIILSLMVLCTGSLFSTVNSLDFLKLLQDDWGYSPARTDFIYLYGGLHTIILLLVYIPAKMRFSEINIGENSNIPPGTSKERKWHDLLSNPFGHFKEVLIAGSPLIASLIQSLFEVLFNQ